MVNGSRTELPVELLGSELLQVLDGEGPKMEDIVPRERLSLLNDDHLGSKQHAVYGQTQPSRTCSYDEYSDTTSRFLQGMDRPRFKLVMMMQGSYISMHM